MHPAERKRLLNAPTFVFVALAPHVWAADCNRNDVNDFQDIAAGTSQDCNANKIPDECDLAARRIQYSEPQRFFTTSTPSEFPRVTKIGDFDGDGDTDLVIMHDAGDSDLTANVTLLRNAGDGTFGPPEVVTSGRFMTAMVSADVEGDGDLDVVIAFAHWQEQVVRALINQGDGTFGLDIPLLERRQIMHLAAADFDDDGDIDIAGTEATGLVVLLNGDGVDFLLSVHVVGVETMPANCCLLATDIDSDRLVDLLVPNNWASSYWFFRNLGGAFEAPQLLSVTASSHNLISGDLDGDGDIDLVAGHTLHFNDGPAAFNPLEAVRIDEGIVRAAEDLDLDGDLDLLVSAANRTVLLFLNDGAGSFSRFVELPFGDSVSWISATDLDGDGDKELLAVFRSRNEVSVHLDQGVAQHPDVNGNNIPDTCEPECFDEDVEDIPADCAPVRFLRGDCTTDGKVNLTDAVCILGRLFAGAEVRCMMALNANGDLEVNLTDAVFVLGFLFGGDSAPVAPFPDCGPGMLPADAELGCANPPDCQ